MRSLEKVPAPKQHLFTIDVPFLVLRRDFFADGLSRFLDRYILVHSTDSRVAIVATSSAAQQYSIRSPAGGLSGAKWQFDPSD